MGTYPYLTDNLPADHVLELKDTLSRPAQESYGIDSPLGLIGSTVLAPVYLYATLKGKFDVWDQLLASLPEADHCGPALDAGCGRGMVLVATAKRRRALGVKGSAAPCYGIDIFDKNDQSGNSPTATVANLLAAGVEAQCVLHTASFTDLPFADGSFRLVTSSLALHNPKRTEDRTKAVLELARVTAPGGIIIIVDLSGWGTTRLYASILRDEGFEVDQVWAGPKVVFGSWWCDVIRARRPEA